MHIRNTVISLLVCSVVMSLPCAVAQVSGTTVTRTRLVALFSDLQKQWFEAVKKKDAGALDRLLGEDYEVWTPAASGPIPREDWQAKAFEEELTSYRIDHMTVRGVRDDVAIENFIAEEKFSRSGKQVTKHSFVVNVWVKDKDGWRCTDTYLSPVSAQSAKPSGPVKPTGRD